MSLIRAVMFATEQHMGQTRADGTVPYIVHPIRVAAEADQAGLGIACITAAVLHDVIEDCPRPAINEAYIAREWPDAYPFVDLLTKRPGQEKEQYYYKLRQAPVAIALKLLDRADNLEEMFQQLRDAPRPDTKKGTFRWAQGYAHKTVIEINPLVDLCDNRYAIERYANARGRLLNLLESV